MFGAGSGKDASSLHLSEESSKETISEAQRLYDEICQMLVAAGYFRARIPTLPPFDKMLGGLAWCITASNVDVDVDLHFDEEMTLGQKIKLGENVIAALRKMGCPSPLQPHQVRGLDFSALFPVFQWLVKHVLSSREQRGAQIRKYSELKFAATHVMPDDEERARQREHALPFVRDVMDRFKATRQFRRRDAGRSALSDVQHVQCVLLEYGQSLPKGKAAQEVAEEGDGAEEAESKLRGGMDAVQGNLDFLSGKRIGALVGMQADAIRGLAAEYEEHGRSYEGGSSRDPEAAARHIRAQAFKRQHNGLQRMLDTVLSRLEARKQANEALCEEVKMTEEALERQKAGNERVVSEIEKLREYETDENKKDMELLLQLVTINEKLEEQEHAFRMQCKSQRAELTSRIENFEEDGGLPEEEMERLRKVEELYESETAKLEKLRQVVALKTQEVHIMKRKIDDVPTRAELVQYERRFVELYEQVATKLEETRRYYTKYNTLTDTHKFLTKEISILNSIYKQYPQVLGKEESKNSFVEQIEGIRKGVQENFERVDGRLKEESSKRDLLNDKLNMVMEKQRVYFQTVKDFQDECAANEKLQAAAERLPAPPPPPPPME